MVLEPYGAGVLDGSRPLICPMPLVHDQLKPDGLTWHNNDILTLAPNAHYRIAASGYVEVSVSEIIR
jgi:hypothetical protein